MPTSSGTLLDGRIRFRQATDGHRTGIEPVLLAAAVPARAGEHILEAGTGAGAGLLCAAWRTGAHGLGVEIDPGQAELARANIAENGLAGLTVATADIAVVSLETRADHAFANPPWHDPAATPSPDQLRALARQAGHGLLGVWVGALARALRHHGTLTLALPAGQAPEAMAALAASGCGSLALLPLWPRAGMSPRLMLMRGVKGGRAPFVLSPGLVLHTADGAFTPAAEAILRDGAPLLF